MNQSASYREVSAEEVQSVMELGGAVRLVDVRERWEYEAYHIPGALLLPLGELSRRFSSELDPAETIICLCEHGVRSRHAAAFLAGQGYLNAATMTGGMAAYSGLVEPSSEESAS